MVRNANGACRPYELRSGGSAMAIGCSTSSVIFITRGWKGEGTDLARAGGARCRPSARAAYLREPRRGLRSSDCRTLAFFRLGLVILKVPLPDRKSTRLNSSHLGI